MLTKREGTSTNTLTYPAAGQPRPHAVTSSAGALNRTFKYDQNGGMIFGQTQIDPAAYGFDAQNRLTELVDAPPNDEAGATGFDCVDQNNSAGGAINVIDLQQVAAGYGARPGAPKFARRDISGDGQINIIDLARQSAWEGLNCTTKIYTYTYDGNGTQTKRQLDQDGATSWTVYVGGVFEKTNTGAVRKYYQAFGRTIAMRDGGTVRFMLQDHLGSTTELLDTAGATVANSEIAYWPYGGTREGGITGTDQLYTGQRQEVGDAQMGLYNYKARFYSTAVGRFVSADPIASDGLDRYTYVRNNPARFTDPSGYCIGSYVCTPLDVLNVIVCASSYGGCAKAIEYLGSDATPELIQMAVDFAEIAIDRSDFWRNFSHPDRNPYWNQDRLWKEAGTWERAATLAELFGYADETGAPYKAAKARKFYEFYIGYCDRVDCPQLGLDLTDLATIASSFAISDPRLAALGLGLYGSEVQLAWDRFESGEGSIGEVWAEVIEGAFAVLPGSNSDRARMVDLARAVQDVWSETICQGEPAACTNITPPF
jgi:RHS repeat-associated protein